MLMFYTCLYCDAPQMNFSITLNDSPSVRSSFCTIQRLHFTHTIFGNIQAKQARTKCSRREANPRANMNAHRVALTNQLRDSEPSLFMPFHYPNVRCDSCDGIVTKHLTGGLISKNLPAEKSARVPSEFWYHF